MRGGARILRGRDEQQMDWGLDDLTGRNVNEPAILEECSIQRGECVIRSLSILGKVLLEQHRIGYEGCSKAAGLYTRRQSNGRGKFGSVMAIEKNETMGGQVSECELINGLH